MKNANNTEQTTNVHPIPEDNPLSAIKE